MSEWCSFKFIVIVKLFFVMLLTYIFYFARCSCLCVHILYVLNRLNPLTHIEGAESVGLFYVGSTSSTASPEDFTPAAAVKDVKQAEHRRTVPFS